MRKLLVTLSFLLLLASLVPAASQVVSWAGSGQKYLSIEPVSDKLLKVTTNEGTGLITYRGLTKVKCEYDAIGEFREGYALLMKGNLVKGVVDKDGNVTCEFSGSYKVNPYYPYFSDGLLAVEGGDGWGYIDCEGKVRIACQYSMALPFSCGVASVCTANDEYYHIGKSGEIRPLSSDFKNTVLSFGFTFARMSGSLASADDTPMAVLIIGNQIYMRDINGNQVAGFPKIKFTSGCTDTLMYESGYELRMDNMSRIVSIRGPRCELYLTTKDEADHFEVTGADYLSSRVSSNGLYELRWRNIPITSPQFQDVKIFDDDIAFVKLNGKYRMVNISEGDNIVIDLAPNLAFGHSIQKAVNGSLKLLPSMSESFVSLSVITGNGTARDVILSNGGFSLPILPSFDDGIRGETEYSFTVKYDGIEYPPFKKTVSYSFDNSFRISCPSTSVMLSQDGSCTIQFRVDNSSDDCSAPCSIYLDGKLLHENVVFEPSSSRTFKAVKSVSLSGDDSRSITHRVSVAEKGCPSFDDSFSVTYLRYTE